ncbi:MULTISPECIES: acyl-CoA dehydrogenase family protein [unclassified Brevundimonas]|uniref:acyl-CoA dehydrogenase family protein n=1 Tax=unclassified Brevundimonas TaxID=2622653 RepID=UPI002002B7F9|nr:MULTISPECIES: acyl-CoA dehydrogenase family protein [unclassified Brevundimonas]MCK6104065.1 acyl-CoA/acyl-ACP dehydrogenase [Brevundimonas sp. EYE_349]
MSHLTKAAGKAPLIDLERRLADLGARYDASPHYPIESMTLLARQGWGRRFAPVESGGTVYDGPAGRALALMDALRCVGRADLSVGRLFEGHVNALALFDWYGDTRQKAWLGAVLAQGGWFGVWATEPPPGVRLIGDRLHGAKMFATGAGGLRHAVVTAQPEQGARQLIIVPADEAERADLSGWRVRGMRATTSGRYDLTGLEIEPEQRLGRAGDYDREPRFTAGAWRFTAVQLGGIEGLVLALREALSEAARGDPIQRARFADAVVAARTAWLWVREAAMRAASEAPDAEDFARATRGVVERSALDVMELAARAVGTRSAFDGERIDKISRDLSLYLRQAGPDYAKDQAGRTWLDRDLWGEGDALW